MLVPSDVDRYSDMRLKLACLNCGSSGMIPWNQLDRVLYCRRCGRLYRVEANGLVELEESQRERFTVRVRSNSSEWHDHEAIVERRLSIDERFWQVARALTQNRIMQLLATCVMALLIITGTTTISPVTPPPAVQLPAALDERALLFAQALVARDMKTMISLTESSEHRALRIWLAHGSDAPPEFAGAVRGIRWKITSRSETGDAGGPRLVRVRFTLQGQEFILEQRWVKKNNQWYFRPIRMRPTLAARPRSG